MRIDHESELVKRLIQTIPKLNYPARDCVIRKHHNSVQITGRIDGPPPGEYNSIKYELPTYGDFLLSFIPSYDIKTAELICGETIASFSDLKKDNCYLFFKIPVACQIGIHNPYYLSVVPLTSDYKTNLFIDVVYIKLIGGSAP